MSSSRKDIGMADEEALKRIEARLTRLEAAITQGGGGPPSVAPPGGAIVDPGPWGGGGWGGWGGWGGVRPISIAPISIDPAPWGGVRPTIPSPIGPIGDPAPFGGAAFSRWPFFPGHVGPVGDPPPVDLSRFSQQQLESSLHTIAAERARLDSTEAMIKERIATLKKQG
jgi:hypothetical protein